MTMEQRAMVAVLVLVGAIVGAGVTAALTGAWLTLAFVVLAVAALGALIDAVPER